VINNIIIIRFLNQKKMEKSMIINKKISNFLDNIILEGKLKDINFFIILSININPILFIFMVILVQEKQIL